MGKYRSRSGCLTCRARRVKCDEIRPICKACSKKNRPCQWEEPHTKFKDYRPEGSSTKSAAEGTGDESETKEDAMNIDGIDGSDGTDRMEGVDEAKTVDKVSEGSLSWHTSPSRKNSRAEQRSESHSTSVSSPSTQLSWGSLFYIPKPKGSTGGVSVASMLQPPHLGDVPEGSSSKAYPATPSTLTHEEALLIHHYTEYLGRWLDCTDATRQFTLGVPENCKQCPVLCQAVLSFAARHCKKHATADIAYQRCIALLIERLDENAADRDETLLCAIVILRFYEQLNVPSDTGSDAEQHLAGCSAILRSSQGTQYVDPSAPTLREAAFWVYVRQCLYNATINQQPPDIDFSLQLHPTPGSMRDSHPLARLRLETGWSNQMMWNTACVVNFCYDGQESHYAKGNKMQRWEELWGLVHDWMKDRPVGFNPIFEGLVNAESVIPEVWFTADWHAISFGFYHFACMMLLRYKPGPRFAIRNVGSNSETDNQILQHARAICGACKSSPETVPLAITACHTIFIWGPLVCDPKERGEVVQLLADFEKNHVWPTTWIINALNTEWGIRATSASAMS